MPDYRVYCILLALTCSSAGAEQPREHQLVALIRFVLADNPTIKKAATYVEISEKEQMKSRAFLFPELSVRSAYNTDHFQAAQGTNLLRYYDAEVTLRQTLFDFSSIVKWREASQFHGEQKYLGDYQKQLIIYETCSLYLAFLRAERLIELSKTNNGLSHEHLNSTKQRFKSGELTINDVNQAETRSLVANTVMAEAVNRHELSRLKLMEVLGQGIQGSPALFNINFQNPAIAKFLKLGKLDMNPNLKSMDYSIKKQELKIQRMKSYNVPMANLTMSQNRNYDTTVSGYRGPLDETAMKFEVSMNLFNGGESIAEQLQSKLELKILQQDREIFTRKTKRQLSEAVKTLDLKLELEKTFTLAAKTAQDAVDGIRKEYLAGSATSIDLMDAQNELFSVRTQLLNSKIESIMSKLDVLLALGLLDFNLFAECITHD